MVVKEEKGLNKLPVLSTVKTKCSVINNENKFVLWGHNGEDTEKNVF